MRTAWGSATDRGLVREVNEDALLAFPPVFLVADGMGGHDAGDLASRIAVEEFASLAGRPSATADEVETCFGRAAGRIRAEFTGGRNGGTTVAGAVLAEQDGGWYWLVFNVGDSRVYRWADGTFERVSVDHTVVQEMVEAGRLDPGRADTHPDRHVLTRALGTGAPPDPDYWLLPAVARDRLLICTDGLTRELPDGDIEGVVATIAEPQVLAAALVARALERGGRDNISVVVVDLEPVTAGGWTATAPGPAPWDEILDGTTLPQPSRQAHVAPQEEP
jgi:protein phosphatase